MQKMKKDSNQVMIVGYIKNYLMSEITKQQIIIM